AQPPRPAGAWTTAAPASSVASARIADPARPIGLGGGGQARGIGAWDRRVGPACGAGVWDRLRWRAADLGDRPARTSLCGSWDARRREGGGEPRRDRRMAPRG